MDHVCRQEDRIAGGKNPLFSIGPLFDLAGNDVKDFFLVGMFMKTVPFARANHRFDDHKLLRPSRWSIADQRCIPQGCWLALISAATLNAPAILPVLLVRRRVSHGMILSYKLCSLIRTMTSV